MSSATLIECPSEAPPFAAGSASAIRLTPLAARHLAKTREWNNEPQLMRWLNRAQIISEAEHAAWFAGLAERRDRLYFAIESGGRHLGNVWLWDIDSRHRRAEVRILIGDYADRSRGLGTEALRQIGDYARDTLKLHRLIVYVLAINPRACRSFEKAGFQLEGILREDRWSGDRFVDVWLMGRML